MSWLSQGLSDIGLSGVNTFFNTAIKPALENPYVDVGLSVAAAALGAEEFSALAPTVPIAADAGADSFAAAAGAPLDLAATAGAPLDLAATAGAPLDLAAVAAGGSDTALSFADTGLGFANTAANSGDLSSFLADPANPGLAFSSGLQGNVAQVGGLPIEASAPIAPTSISAATTAGGFDPLTSGGGDLGNWLDTTNFGNTLSPSVAATGGAAPSAGTLDLSNVNAGDITNVATAGNAGAANPGVLSQIGSGLKTAAPFLGAAGLGYNLYEGYETKQALNALNQETQGAATNLQQNAATATNAASPLLSQGETLMHYLTTNTLPPQYQSQIKQTIAAQQAQIIQGYASRGQNTNPQQNSALAQDLNNVQQQAVTLQTNIEQQLATAGNQMVQTANSLLQSGANATQISAELPIQIAQLNASLNATTSTAISNFAAAMNGGANNRGNITLNIPQNSIA